VIEDALLLQVEPVIRTALPPTRAIVNAGLWLDDPDVDAITRLCNDIVATECHSRPAFFGNLLCLCAHGSAKVHPRLLLCDGQRHVVPIQQPKHCAAP